METVIGLQELINDRAAIRLKKDLQQLSASIRDNRLLNVTNSDSIPDLIYDHKEQKPFCIFKYGSKYMDAVAAYWLPIYQNEEAQIFLQKVEDLNNDVAELMDNKTYD